MLAGHAPELLHERAAGVGEVDGVEPAVVGVAAALDQPALLQAVDQGDEARRRSAEMPGECLLAASRLERDRAEESGLRGSQVELGDPRRELLGGIRAELGQEERAAHGRRPVASHGRTVSLDAWFLNEDRYKDERYTERDDSSSSPGRTAPAGPRPALRRAHPRRARPRHRPGPARRHTGRAGAGADREPDRRHRSRGCSRGGIGTPGDLERHGVPAPAQARGHRTRLGDRLRRRGSGQRDRWRSPGWSRGRPRPPRRSSRRRSCVRCPRSPSPPAGPGSLRSSPCSWPVSRCPA